MGESRAGSGLALECCREEVGGRGEPCSFRYSDPWFHLWLTVMFLSSLPCVLVGKPSSFFPEDSFIDSGEIDVGRRASQKIPPGTFWRSQVFIDHPVHLKFNVSLGKAALVGIYGRKGLPPSHTQVNQNPMYPSPLQGLPPQILTRVKKPDVETWIPELGGSFTNFIVHSSICPLSDPAFQMSRAVSLELFKRKEF